MTECRRCGRQRATVLGFGLALPEGPAYCAAHLAGNFLGDCQATENRVLKLKVAALEKLLAEKAEL